MCMVLTLCWRRGTAGTSRPGSSIASAVAGLGLVLVLVTVHGTITSALAQAGAVASAVTITGAVVELVLCPLLDALLVLRTWHRLVGGAVTIAVTILLRIDACGNRPCRFWGVGLSQRHARGHSEQSDGGECEHHLAHDHSLPSVSRPRCCRNLSGSPWDSSLAPLTQLRFDQALVAIRMKIP